MAGYQFYILTVNHMDDGDVTFIFLLMMSTK